VGARKHHARRQQPCAADAADGDGASAVTHLEQVMDTTRTFKTSDDRGSAMVLGLLIVLALSVIGASLTVLSLSETYGSMNYRLMTQARYGAEAGVHKTVNFLIYNYSDPPTGADTLALYDYSRSPVLAANGQPVILSAANDVTANYPVQAVQDLYHAAGTGSLVFGNANVQYQASAKLIAMRQVDVYGSTTPVTVQTWLITSDGTTTGARNAKVEVTATLEREMIRLYQYAVFATATTCGALKFGGGATVDSYDSQNITYVNGTPVTQQYDGNIGSNGNLNENGHQTTIDGTMSTPRSGVGNCAASGVDAWSDNGGATVTGGLVQLPQAVVFPTPDVPNPLPPNTPLGLNSGSTCAGITGCTAGSPSGIVLPPGTYGDINLTGQAVVHLKTGVYGINSISMQGQSKIIIDSGPVVLNVYGANQNTPVDFTGGTLINSTLDSSNLQIEYAGGGNIRMEGGAQSSGTVYAPNAAVSLNGGSDWYGAVIGATVDDTGGTKVHNDRRLANEFFSVGNNMLSAFSWKKF
jgi:hypothetical protein